MHPENSAYAEPTMNTAVLLCLIAIAAAWGMAQSPGPRGNAMERQGKFFVFRKEWWHYTYQDYRKYAVLDVPFPAIEALPETP